MTLRRTLILLLILAVCVGIFWLQRAPFLQDSPAGTAAASPQSKPAVTRIAAEGRLAAYPGNEITVSADFTGILGTLNVKEGDAVRRGQSLASIHAEDTEAALEHAQSRVKEYAAEIKLANQEQVRAQKLAATGAGSRQTLDKAQSVAATLRAQRATALAETRRLQAVLNKAKIIAPISGIVIERHIDAGEAVEPGTPVVTIADLSRLRIEAEVDEYDVARVHLNDLVEITAEGYDMTWQGRVEEIPRRVTTRRMKPQDPARPVDTRVLQVKVALITAVPLKLGQRVEIYFNAAAAATPGPPAAINTERQQ